MKRYVLFGILSMLLCGVLFAQSRPTRYFVGMDGPVKSARLEIAQLTRKGDSVVEGPRTLKKTDEVNEDGTETVSKEYKPDGSVDSKQVNYYEPDGTAKESLVYRSGDRLSIRIHYEWGSNGSRMEITRYGEDGSIISKDVRGLDRSTSQVTGDKRDKDGNVVEKMVATKDAEGRHGETRTSFKSGAVSGEVKTVILSDRQNERQFYDAEGVLKAKIVTTIDHKGEWVERTTYDGDGKLVKKDSYERDYDTQGNWIKQVVSKWNPQTGKSEPTEVHYRTITYYEK